VQAAQVDQLLGELHLRVEPALFWHVAEAGALGLAERRAVERDRAGVGGEHAEDHAHRGGLAGAVAADEAGDAASAHGEGDILQHCATAVRPSDIVHFEKGGVHASDATQRRCAAHPS
jgi:hypothetical protein